MQRSLKFAAFPVLMALVVTAVMANPYRRPTKVTTSCCKSVSRTWIPYNITGYREQNALEPCVSAIIFYTKEVGPVCSNPIARWVQNKIKGKKNKYNIYFFLFLVFKISFTDLNNYVLFFFQWYQWSINSSNWEDKMSL
ncbi:eotaxin-like [Acipenser oxyrinchus oxyrinchus]|uniref:Eotaxin-like n=1 Tax=Acipenser oxyrinchus oxyrinchus TaxID=40147 RepID=A0AAD8DEL2_ACIOX|nr:eotaxin-like [Acipenser oxyrinchus oxyrinchus]